MKLALQVNSNFHSELSQVPLAIDFAKSDEAGKLVWSPPRPREIDHVHATMEDFGAQV
jgi:hypothetical protein